MDPDLRDAAEEEAQRAIRLAWAQLRPTIPWGDTYEGFTPAGREVCFERAYLWDTVVGGDIRLELSVYEPRDYEHGVTIETLIPRAF